MHPDHQYIEALRNNDPKGINAIYARFSEEALRWVLNNNGNSDDASDVFQEAVLALYEKARDASFVLTCPLGALLYLIYSRKWIDRLRAKKREHTVRIQEEARYSHENTSDALSIAEEAIQGAEQEKRLSAAFQQLSELCQKLLRLLAQGCKPKDAALELQMNGVDTLYRRKNACVQRWRELTLTL